MAMIQLFEWYFQTKVFKDSPSNLQLLLSQCFVAVGVLKQEDAASSELIPCTLPFQSSSNPFSIADGIYSTA